ncbi:MAG: hypothetical protein K0Q70_1119 [Rhodospirillales bacterium]|nr:hypothetical protein [Rhodospirillales bacterium]
MPPGNSGDTVTDRENLADFGNFRFGAEVLNLIFENRGDFRGADFHLTNPSHGETHVLQLGAERRIDHPRTDPNDEAAEKAGIDARFH